MKILLDSTYFFPIIDIEISEGWTKNQLLSLLQDPAHDLYFCDLSVFELYTKAMKLIIQHKIDISINQIQNGLQSLLNTDRFQKIIWWEHLYESDIVLELKRQHSDSIDCELFYLAVVNCEIFATFDRTMLKRFKSNKNVVDWIKKVNPSFRIWEKCLEKKPYHFL